MDKDGLVKLSAYLDSFIEYIAKNPTASAKSSDFLGRVHELPALRDKKNTVKNQQAVRCYIQSNGLNANQRFSMYVEATYHNTKTDVIHMNFNNATKLQMHLQTLIPKRIVDAPTGEEVHAVEAE
ncbi:MAG: hypothetical protein MK193_09445 [Lentisphaeria bacterium]|nr:hypothetical protein [Lentisphaeria bacterium]